MGDIGKLLDPQLQAWTCRRGPRPSWTSQRLISRRCAVVSKSPNVGTPNLEVLKAAIRAQLEKLIRLNSTSAPTLRRNFEELIDSYNTGSRNIEELFNELVNLSRSLSEEQQRHVREDMTEEELVIFDILTRPAPELSADSAVRRSQNFAPQLRIGAQLRSGAQ